MTPEECREWHGRETERVERIARDAADIARDVGTAESDRLGEMSRSLGRLESHASIQWWMLVIIIGIMGTGVGALLAGKALVVIPVAQEIDIPPASAIAIWGDRLQGYKP